MTEETDDHRRRVHEAFDSFARSRDGKLDEEARGSVEKLKDAASRKDTEAARLHLEQVRQTHGWLYRELAAHPAVATLLDELALLGL